jgi:hypothetical protein
MSDDLVKLARHNALADMPHYASVELIEAVADRIEELEAKLAKAVEAAHQLASDAIPCACHDCIEAHTTLAELKGQDDE